MKATFRLRRGKNLNSSSYLKMTVEIIRHFDAVVLLRHVILVLLRLLLPVRGRVQHVLVLDLVRHVFAPLPFTWKKSRGIPMLPEIIR